MQSQSLPDTGPACTCTDEAGDYVPSSQSILLLITCEKVVSSFVTSGNITVVTPGHDGYVIPHTVCQM